MLLTSISGVVKYQPTVEFTCWISVMGIFTTSSIGRRKRPMQSRPQQGSCSLAHRFAKTQDNRLFLRAHREKSRAKKDNHQNEPSPP